MVDRGYKKEDVWHFLKVLKARYGKVKFAVFLDNATIHTSDATRLYASDLGIPLIFNLPYRPEYNGLENLWLHTKAEYKTTVLAWRYQGVSWDNAELAAKLIEKVDTQVLVKGLQRGLENLVNAKPAKKPQDEQVVDEMNEFCKFFANAPHRIGMSAQRSPDDVDMQGANTPDQMGSCDEWEPLPLDNMDGIDREPPGVKSPRPPRSTLGGNQEVSDS